MIEVQKYQTPEAGAPWLSVRGVSRRYTAEHQPVQALSGVDLSISQGSFSAILGPSGCGKSTLLKIVAGIDRQDEGEIELAGQRLSGPDLHLPAERRGIGIVPQEGALFPHLNVAGNVGFGLDKWNRHALSRQARRARAERIGEMLDLVGLAGYEKRRPDELSGGQQQRVALARALAPAPKLILLDEPFSSLDAALRADLRVEVRELLRQAGTTAILVTHDQEEALSLADQVAIMWNGQIVQAGAPQEIYNRPANPAIASFVGEAVLLPGVMGECQDDIAVCELGNIAVCASCVRLGRGPCTLMVRPEQVQVGSDGLPAMVRGYTFFGHDAIVTLGLGEDGSGSAVTVRVPEGTGLRPGDRVRVRVVGDAMAYARGSAARPPGIVLPGADSGDRSQPSAFS